MRENAIPKIIAVITLVFFTSIVLIAVFPLLNGKYWISADSKYEFNDVSGPDYVSKIKKPHPTHWKTYNKGTVTRLAILLTDENSAWLGLAHGLKTIGIPFRITTNIDEALQHKVVLVYPVISGKVLTPHQLKQIAEFIRSGGNLIGTNVLGGGFNSIFGFESVSSTQDHFKLELQNNHPVSRYGIDTDLHTIRLSTKQPGDQAFGTHSYLAPKHPPLAVYNDGSAAIVYNKFSNSEVYAIGFDIGFYLLKAYNRRMENVAATYANGFEASVDVLLNLLKAIYQRHEPAAITLGTVPYARSLSVILTHDIDYNRSLKNALVYAKHEQESQSPATHFIQTKYIRDWNDKVFFNHENIHLLSRLKELDIELASHSVSHSLLFHDFELGNGKETYPEYSPYVKNENTTYNGSILGELRVSKFLIEHFSPGTEVVSFRPGYLSNPLALPQAMTATGYRYSSSVTANVSLTHLPFRLNYNRDTNSELDVYEFPITVEDELPPKMGDRLNEAIDLAHKISRYGGMFVVLIHPDILDHKLDFQTKFVNAIKPHAWFGTLGEFGDWWSARDRVEIDIEESETLKRVHLNIPETVNGLVITVPESWRLIKPLADNLKFKQVHRNVILEQAHGNIQLVFEQ